MTDEILEKANKIKVDIDKLKKELSRIQKTQFMIKRNNVKTRIGIAEDNTYQTMTTYHIDTNIIHSILEREVCFIKQELRIKEIEFKEIKI